LLGSRGQMGRSLESRGSSKDRKTVSPNRSPSPRQKVWDPVVGEEDKVAKKKGREDEYQVKGRFDEPVLHVSKKEITSRLVPSDNKYKPDSPSKVIKKTYNVKYVDADSDQVKKRLRNQSNSKYSAFI
jgi:hypothetical protein